MSDTEIKNKTNEQYEILVALFSDLLSDALSGTLDLEDLADIIENRINFSFEYCSTGFGLDFDDALEIVKNGNEHLVTSQEKDRRKCLVAALENLIDFVIASQTQMYMDFDETEDPEEVFEMYNKRFAEVENADIWFMATIADWFTKLPEYTTLMYMTQGDERVRDSHRALEGLSYPKASFPEWLIPPIDWRCRCYLVESFASANYKEFDKLDDKIEKAVNPIFRESLAKGGRIFSDAHPYFNIDERLKDKVMKLSKDFKLQYNLKA